VLPPEGEIPPGATVTDAATVFAVASEVADGMLPLFDETGAETRIPSRDHDAGIRQTKSRHGGPTDAGSVDPWDPARGAPQSG